MSRPPHLKAWSVLVPPALVRYSAARGEVYMVAWTWWMFLGCGEPAAPPAPAPTPPPAPVVEAPKVPEWKILAPSPLALEAEVRAAGVADTLAGLVPASPPMPPPDEKDRVAFRTGIVFSYTLLGGRAAEKQALVANVRSLRDGMEAIGTGKGLLATMDRGIEGLVNDAASREDFLLELDAQVSSSVPEQGWGPNDTTGPMLQAGAWLAGTNLAARAVIDKSDPIAAQKLLRRPEVAAFFLKYIRSGEGAAKAGSMAGKVSEALRRIEEVSSKPQLDLADAKAIAEATDGLLRLF